MSLNSEWLTQQLFKDSNADAYPSSSKQVRFRQNVLHSANGSADRVSTYDFTETGFDELTNVTSFSNSDSISIPQTRCPLDNKSTLNQFCSTQTSCDAPETMKNNANNIVTTVKVFHFLGLPITFHNSRYYCPVVLYIIPEIILQTYDVLVTRILENCLVI
uniref:SJCHGC02659 protein n=1 Tax=Schistosoma japonicum TaxID=6182 RepID=Q5DAS9_SCHJA|nr:SJCHGC02659 protein [Schistosoma japonicum]